MEHDSHLFGLSPEHLMFTARAASPGRSKPMLAGWGMDNKVRKTGDGVILR